MGIEKFGKFKGCLRQSKKEIKNLLILQHLSGDVRAGKLPRRKTFLSVTAKIILKDATVKRKQSDTGFI